MIRFSIVIPAYNYGAVVERAVRSTCEQAGDDNFYELALMALRASVPTVTSSRMRAFRGDRIEVLQDGSNGEAAVVRVHGSDDTYWLVETHAKPDFATVILWQGIKSLLMSVFGAYRGGSTMNALTIFMA